MKQTQTDLRQSFHDWLVRQGLSEKTKTGRAGTVYEYVRYIDKVCDIVQSKHDGDSWKWLAKNIYPILGFYILCRKDPVVINFKNKARLEGFLTEFFNCWPSYSENSQKYLVMQTPLSEKDDINSYRMIQEVVWDSLEINKSEITLYLNIPKTVANNERKALKKFYQFLCDWLTLQKAEQYGFDYSKIRGVQNQLDNLRQETTKPIFRFIVRGGTNRRPPQLEPNTGHCGADWIRELFGKASRGMAIPIKPDSTGKYSVPEVNEWVKNNFQTSKKKEGPEEEEWWTTKRVLKETGWTKDILKRKRKKIAHIAISDRKIIFYPPDVLKEAHQHKKQLIFNKI